MEKSISLYARSVYVSIKSLAIGKFGKVHSKTQIVWVFEPGNLGNVKLKAVFAGILAIEQSSIGKAVVDAQRIRTRFESVRALYAGQPASYNRHTISVRGSSTYCNYYNFV